MISISSLEWHVSHNCNFSCNYCCDFSNYKHNDRITRQTLLEWYKPWHQRIKPDTVALLGGEPLLNKDIINIIIDAKQYWPQSQLELVTNGWLIENYPTLLDTLRDTNTKLYISKHVDTPEYNAKFDSIVNKVRDKGLKVSIYPNHKIWYQIYKGTGTDIEPYEDSDPESSWNNCPTYQDCFQLYDSQIWKCPPVAYINLLAKKIQLNTKWNEYLSYRALQPNCSDQQIVEFFSKGAEKVCGMCAAKVVYAKKEVKWQP